MSESIVLLVLGACWVAYLGWYWRENRRDAVSRSDGIRTFSSGLGSLAGSAHRSSAPGSFLASSLVPRGSDAAARRRREVLVSLVAVCVVTLFAALALGPAALVLHVIADATLLGYGYAVVQRRNAAAEREIKVTMLYPDRRGEPRPARRAAHG